MPELIGRITIDEIDVYTEPISDPSLIVGKRYRDQVVTLYHALDAPAGPAYNPVWYRVWGGYVHSAYVQLVKMSFASMLETVPDTGQFFEVSVPFTDSLLYDHYDGWRKQYRLYYETTHWVTGIEQGPDGKPWYEITNELDSYLVYFAPVEHLRPIPYEEIAPLSPHVPAEEKRIEVSIREQSVTVFEGDREVFNAKVSTGIHSSRPTTNGIPTDTPRGNFRIGSKSPSKHMGALLASGAPRGYSLPGVPWTSFFVPETGVAFHGTFWHNNFGLQMSHGCVNMRNADAKWLFRWSMPAWENSERDRLIWDVRGYMEHL